VPLGFFFYNRERGGKNQNGLVVARFREVDCDGVVPMSPVGIVYRGDHFRFSSFFIKKINKPNLKKKKLKPNQNRFKPIGFGLDF
jgi:hypothetical protein